MLLTTIAILIYKTLSHNLVDRTLRSDEAMHSGYVIGAPQPKYVEPFKRFFKTKCIGSIW